MANLGTNLSQVFIANDSTLGPTSGSAFNSLASTAASTEVGIWNVAGSAWITSKLYEASIDFTANDSATDETTSDLITAAHPNWLYSRIQIAQGATGQPIATPLIDTRNIRRIRFEPGTATVGHYYKFTPNASVFTNNDITCKIIVRTTPSDQLSFHDANGTGYTDLSGAGKVFPLGAFNTTNHKVFSLEILASEYTTAGTFIDKLDAAIAAHPVLDDLLNVTDGSTYVEIQSRFPGVIFDVLFLNSANGTSVVGSAANDVIVQTTKTNYNPGVGNDWQVLGEEIRCRSRQGNFNRMYLPNNPVTYTKEGTLYNKLTIEYDHNWPTSTGIAPAGTLNQAVIYSGDNSTADTTGDTNMDTIFSIAAMGTAQEFVW
jgi:hypothetical protein